MSLCLVVFVDSCGILISLSSLNIRIDKVGWRGGEVVRCVANGRDVLIWESGGNQDYTVGLYSMIYAVYNIQLKKAAVRSNIKHKAKFSSGILASFLGKTFK